jgi:predicted dinucleotide-binding enzyme
MGFSGVATGGKITVCWFIWNPGSQSSIFFKQKKSTMKIAIIGTGNVGGALATRWAQAGHTIRLGVQDFQQFKGKHLLENPSTAVFTIADAVVEAEVVLLAIPPAAVMDLLPQLGNLAGKVAIDATNAVRQGPGTYPTVYHCLADKTLAEVVKCFNTTGFENMLNPVYHGEGIDMFMAGHSDAAKQTARTLALDAGFGECWDFGKADKVQLLEQFALSWINLAIIQGHGRNLAFKVIKR